MVCCALTLTQHESSHFETKDTNSKASWNLIDCREIGEIADMRMKSGKVGMLFESSEFLSF